MVCVPWEESRIASRLSNRICCDYNRASELSTHDVTLASASGDTAKKRGTDRRNVQPQSGSLPRQLVPIGHCAIEVPGARSIDLPIPQVGFERIAAHAKQFLAFNLVQYFSDRAGCLQFLPTRFADSVFTEIPVPPAGCRFPLAPPAS